MTITPEPADARVTINDVERTTYDATYGEVVNYTVEKDGYQSETATLYMIRDYDLTVTLQEKIYAWTHTVSGTEETSTVYTRTENPIAEETQTTDGDTITTITVGQDQTVEAISVGNIGYTRDPDKDLVGDDIPTA